MKKLNLTVLPGDGIGTEIMDAAIQVLESIGRQFDFEIEYTSKLVGGCSIDKYGEPLTKDTLAACFKSDAVLLGAVGGPKWENLAQDKKPEKALLNLRKSLGLFSNLRPATIYPALAGASSLKPEVIKGSNVMVVRELTGGIYFGDPRGFDEHEGKNTLIYTRPEVERIARVAFELAGKRNNHVTSVDKANVLDSSQFWRNIIHEVHQDYPNVELVDMYVDNAAMQLIRDPRQFDVIVTQNMFGDILSDIAAMLTGSLGMLPSASIGEKYALYEPVHGTAPDLAGLNKANPLAMIGSVAMMLKYSFDLTEASDQIYKAISDVLSDQYRTEDIYTPGMELVSTSEMRDLIIEKCTRLDNKTAWRHPKIHPIIKW